jgi:hypothetical protein
MTDPTEIVMEITKCPREKVVEALARFMNVVDATEYLLFGDSKPESKKRKVHLTPEQEEIAKVRKVMEAIDSQIETKLTSANRPASGE